MGGEMRHARSVILLGCAALALAGWFAGARAEDPFDALNKVLNDANALKAPAPAAQPPGSPTEALAPLADNKIPAPMPATAEEIEYDAADGSLDYTSASSVRQIADFYRAAMKPLGWTEHRSPINKDNMIVLDFAKDKQTRLSFTIMRMGDHTKVSANGPPLVTQSAQAAAPDAASAAAGAPDPDLTVEDSGGLPIPAPHSSSGSESSLFRHSANASTAASIAGVVAFYRRELAKRDWKELAEKAAIKPDSAQLAFTAPEGPAVLKLGRESGETTIVLSVRDDSKAAKSPLLPKPGQVKLMLGNMRDKAAEVTINGKPTKVPAGAGAKGPDGPIVDLPPGKYDVALKTNGQPSQHENIEAGPNEIWMLMIGPGGMLSVQAY